MTAAYSGDFSTMGDRDNIHSPTNILSFWWGAIPDALRQISANTGTNSNIRFDDYAGSAACVKCHSKEHQQWVEHSHRRMNASATAENVFGDFSGAKTVEYQGGTIEFLTQVGSHRMRLTKGERSRLFQITQTVGSKIHQYYVGIMIEGEESEAEELRLVEHVMPFAWSIRSKEWIPTSHVHRAYERSDDQVGIFSGADIVPYEADCAGCHTTSPFGDWLLPYANANRMAIYSPHPVAFEISRFLYSEHPKLIPRIKPPERIGKDDYEEVSMRALYLGMEGHRIERGVGCEACHYGSREHAATSTANSTTQRPKWLPANPHLHTQTTSVENSTSGLMPTPS